MTAPPVSGPAEAASSVLEGSVPPAAQRPPEPVILEALLPVEQYSSDREESISHVVLHFMSALVTNPADPLTIWRAAALPCWTAAYRPDYIIDREGSIHRLIPEERAAWHAGKGTWQRDGRYTNRMNQYAIGIELLGMGTEEKMSLYVTPAEYAALDPGWIGFTDAQYASLRLFARRYPLPLSGHTAGPVAYSRSRGVQSLEKRPGRAFFLGTHRGE